ncbi:XkdX family protein [Paenibacillus melissococcoides]|uniref:XkdX family protein n=1 Tax=Paenibacillus melissococcoides TaxID=2912268 RepID=A0ABM9FUL7_9BACL|nr:MULTISPECIES: XkdX family protein [Paenibacillus]MEB9892676.1 XkdX family protein [Bacillus cereus]QVQ56252.1 XkdX family protein [Paenibacillus phage Pd_22F]CAH8242822.1 XkdX family protein [Paenibacillus melissococcoides]CAH8245132.1 XkdX family protein [Paenibacillus melissococcoides]CAH8245710.1 XkdX family protein [Paenibacillus melissococcoides]
MNFWKLAFDCEWIDAEGLCAAVKTEANRFGEITPEEYEKITGIKFPTQE